MAVSNAAKTAMQKGRVESAKARKNKKAAAQARAKVAREARVGKKAAATKATPKKWGCGGSTFAVEEGNGCYMRWFLAEGLLVIWAWDVGCCLGGNICLRRSGSWYALRFLWCAWVWLGIKVDNGHRNSAFRPMRFYYDLNLSYYLHLLYLSNCAPSSFCGFTLVSWITSALLLKRLTHILILLSVSVPISRTLSSYLLSLCYA